ncbi:5873_t:CDS:1, partial [Paraglomus occultum]
NWMFMQMLGNPRRNIAIDSILRWNYYGGVGEQFNKDFFRNEKTGANTLRTEDKGHGTLCFTDNNKIKNRE